MSRVAVIGAGVAGLAATWAARQAGADVVLLDGGPGASSFQSGALDDVPWDELARATARSGGAGAAPLGDEIQAFSRALALWELGDERVVVASAAGRLRGARGCDLALLDLARLAGNVVALPRADRAGWDADALAAAFADDPAARALQLRFLAVDADILKFDAEDRIPDADLAARHDDVARLAWFADRLHAAVAGTGAGAVLVGPWLGVDEPRARHLTSALRMPIGEVMFGAAGTAGLRFERARARLLTGLGVDAWPARVTRLRAGATEDEALEVELEHFGAKPRDAANALRSDAVVFAFGGVVSGGVVYAPPEASASGDLPDHAGPPFRLSFEIDAPAGGPLARRLLGAPRQDARGVRAAAAEPFGISSSMQGPNLDLDAWPRGDQRGVLERVGVVSDGAGRVTPRVFVAGDARAGRPRTVLEAVRAGAAAGAAAAVVTPVS